MHSHSFQDTKFKLLTHVKIFQEQVVEGLTILRNPRGLENKGLITQKNVNSTCIRTVFEIRSGNFTGTSTTPRRQVVEWLTILPFPQQGSEIKGLITQNTGIRRAFAQFSRLRAETSQERRRHLEHRLSRGLTILPFPSQGSEIKG